MSQCICNVVFPEPKPTQRASLDCSLCHRFLFKLAVDTTLDNMVSLNQKLLDQRARNDTLQLENDCLRVTLAQLEAQLSTLQGERTPAPMAKMRKTAPKDVNKALSGSSAFQKASLGDSSVSTEDDSELAVNPRGDSVDPLVAPGFDPALVAEFEEFLRELRRLPETVPASRVNSMPFMRRCIEEDIGPCLRGLGWFGTRRALEAFGDGRFFVELAPEVTTEAGCSACGQLGSCSYRYKLREAERWRPIDRVCRERFVAVGNFFSFVRTLHSRLTKRSGDLELFTQCYVLRELIFSARAGLIVDASDENLEQGPILATLGVSSQTPPSPTGA